MCCVALAKIIGSTDGSLRTSSDEKQDVATELRVRDGDAEDPLKQNGLVTANRMVSKQAVVSKLSRIDKSTFSVG